MRRLLRISSSFAIVLVAYWAYSLLAVPWIEPRAAARMNNLVIGPQEPRDRMLGFEGLFGPGDWELREQTKILESDQVKLLWDSVSSTGDPRTMTLSPCTMIYSPNGASAVESERGRGAIVLQARQGAELTFDEPFDVSRRSLGRLVRGSLKGRITVRSQGKSPGPEDDLWIATSGLELAEDSASKIMKIETPSEVEFSLGPNQGHGRHLKIKLLPSDDAGSSKRHGMNISGVDSLEVLSLDWLRLRVPATGMGLGPSPSQAQSAPAQAQAPPIPLEITCKGPFRFDLGSQLATFENQVDLRMLNPDGPSDQINCELLAIGFARRRPSPAAADQGKPPPEENANASSLSDLQPDWIEAEGNPVVVHAPSKSVEARGKSLKYHLSKGLLVLRDPQEAFLSQAGNQIRARWLEYELGAAGHLGQARATGPGWVRVQMEGRQPFEARWGRTNPRPDEFQLRLWRDESQQALISLEGGAELGYGMLGSLSAPEIHCWLLELPPATPQDQLRILPDRMVACTKDATGARLVQISSPKLSGTVNRMEVWFEQQPAAPGQPQRPADPRPTTTFQGPPTAMRLAAQMANRMPASWQTVWRPLATQPPEGTLGQQFRIEGDLLRARVANVGEKGDAEPVEMTIDGSVRVEETGADQPQEKRLVIMGDRVHAVDATKPYGAISVTGRPAYFKARGLALTGSNINLNRGTNRLWIDGPGTMDLPVPSSSGSFFSAASGAPGRPVAAMAPAQGPATAAETPVIIQWQEGMTLVDSTASFAGRVVAASQDQGQQLSAETIEARFKQPIRFAEMKADTKPEVEQITCRGASPSRPVELESRQSDTQGQTSFDRMKVPDLTIHMGTGAISASGPGRVTSVRRGTPDMLGQRPGESAAPAAKSDGLNYLDIRFQQSITGNFQWREMTFHERVLTVYGPVPAWDSTLSADDPDRLGPHGGVLNCDELTVVQSIVPVGNAQSVGMTASGNVVAEGQKFTARASRMTYDQGKGLLVLEGNGRTDAALFVQQRPGERRSEHALKIYFWPATKNVTVAGSRMLELNGLSGPAK